MQTAGFDFQIYQLFNPSALKCARTSTNVCNVEFDRDLFYTLSCKDVKDWVTKSAFLAKGNLAILLFTKENKNWTKDKIDPQHLHLHLQVIKSIFHGDVGLFWQLYYVCMILVVWYGFPHQNENLNRYHYWGELTHQM